MRSSDHPQIQWAVIEPLEPRRLLSAGLSAAFSGRVPAVVTPESANHIELRLTNTGTTPAIATAVQLFASTTTTLEPGDPLLVTTMPELDLKARHAANVSVAFSSPTTIATGHYYLLADVNGSIITASAKPVTIESPVADLAVQFITLPARPLAIQGRQAGARGATVGVFNTGNLTQRGNVNVSLYLSATGVIDSSTALLGTISNRTIALKPGGHAVLRFGIAVPPGTVVGGYFLIAVLTPSTGVGDANPANNVVVSARRIAVVTQLPQRSRGDDRADSGDYTNFIPCDNGCCNAAPVIVDNSSDCYSNDSGDDSSQAIDDSDSSDDDSDDGSNDSGNNDDGT